MIIFDTEILSMFTKANVLDVIVEALSRFKLCITPKIKEEKQTLWEKKFYNKSGLLKFIQKLERADNTKLKDIDKIFAST